jgi:hypothetical protein
MKDKLMTVYEVYETNGNKALLFLDRKLAEKQNIISGDVAEAKVYINDLEAEEIKNNGYIWA